MNAIKTTALNNLIAIEAALDIDQTFKALTASLPKTPVKGKDTTKFTVTEVSNTVSR